MRRAFAQALVELAEVDDRVVLLTGDLGYTVLEPFAERFPNRFFNVGVAEQNMLGMANGLAEAGYVPFAYSIATFASLRPYEFLRNGAIAHGLPVRLVGVGGGFEYGHNGISHFALEDIGVMRVQPRLTVLAPADAGQVRTAALLTRDLPGPAYLRVGKLADPIEGLDGSLRLGRAEILRDGGDLAIIALGSATRQALTASSLLLDQGVAATVVCVGCVAPAPYEDIAEVVARVPLVITVEGHYNIGGLGSLVAEVIAETAAGSRLVRHGVEDMPVGITGSQEALERRYGLDGASLAQTALGLVSVATEAN